MTSRARTTRVLVRARGFSLIEILIAVVVLSLGLLGLGMVFPVVVRQQRQAQDSIQGLSTARSAAEYVQARRAVVEALLKVGEEWYPNDRHTKIGQAEQFDGEWLVDSSSVGGGATFVTDRTNGLMTIGLSSAPQYIGLYDRLAPAPFTSSGGPQFVWDLALRASGPGQVEVAVFTRRIDAGIRIPTAASSGIKQYTLSHVLTGEPSVPAANRRVPVAVDKNGRPTLTGLNESGSNKNAYSPLVTVSPVNPESGDPENLLRLNSSDLALLGQARQPGQKLVDNRGVVHTVVRAAENTTNGVILEKALTEVQFDEIAASQMQFLMTPQVPAAVMVITLRE